MIHFERDRKLGPREMILDLLRAHSPKSMSVGTLIRIGETFSLSENQIRVSLNRLTASGRIHSPQRSEYALAKKELSGWHFFQSWRLGNYRKKNWSGSWITFTIPTKKPRSAISRSKKCLWMFGFRHCTDTNLYLRPLNLRYSLQELKSTMWGMGLEDNLCPWISSHEDPQLTKVWRSLWQEESWNEYHKESMAALESSIEAISGKNLTDALRESFFLGGMAIEVLLKDPLLPSELSDEKSFTSHTKLMNKYDEISRQLWKNILESR